MTTMMLKIEQYANCSHANQSYMGVLPDGWAIVPANLSTPNFPFGDVEVTELDGVPTVTKWTPREIPVTPDPPRQPTEAEMLRADIDYLSMMTGVDLPGGEML